MSEVANNVEQAVVKETAPKQTSSSLPKSVFGIDKVNTQVVFDTIMSERASRRQGTHKVKNRGEVSGTGKKPWRQKGTGRARTGSLRTPVFVGGGRALTGPTPERNYNLKVNKKARTLALTSALTLKANENAIIVNDINMSTVSTKELVKTIDSLKPQGARNILIVTENENVFKSANNIQRVGTVKVNSISVESIVWADAIILSTDHIKALEERVAK